jgi:hypothetical protein
MASLSELFRSTDEQVVPVEAAVTGETTLPSVVRWQHRFRFTDNTTHTGQKTRLTWKWRTGVRYLAGYILTVGFIAVAHITADIS